MLGRTLGSATLAIAIGFSVQVPARAQNLEAGKSPAQVFNGACATCHKSPRGLVKSVPPGSLQGFLRQHYTTSGDMAGALSNYLLANGGVDRRPAAAEKPRRGRDARPAAAPQPAPAPGGWWPFRAASPAPQAAEEARPSGRASGAKHKAKTKKSKSAPAQDDATQQPSHDSAGSGGAKPESVTPAASKPEPANSAPAAQRPDPVPAVTPAAEPKLTEPKVTEPKASEPAASAPPASESKVSEPKVPEPKAAEPKAD